MTRPEQITNNRSVHQRFTSNGSTQLNIEDEKLFVEDVAVTSVTSERSKNVLGTISPSMRLCEEQTVSYVNRELDGWTHRSAMSVIYEPMISIPLSM